MSSFIYCSRFRRGDPHPFPEAALAVLSRPAIDAPTVCASGPGSVDPWFEHMTMSRLEGGGCFAVTLSRPCNAQDLLEALLALLRLEGTVAYAPDSPPVSGHAATAAHLPASMIEAIGEPMLVTAAPEVSAALFGNTPSAA